MRGSCKCKNIKIHWQTVDYSLVPRKCQCQYCKEKDAAYVSKSGSRIDVYIHNERMHNTLRHGTNCAIFHECGNCGELVFVTANIDGEIFGALNANCMKNGLGFAAAIETNFSEQTAEEKKERWRKNWCHPVLITSQGTQTLKTLRGFGARA
jgi:hypothetical protein